MDNKIRNNIGLELQELSERFDLVYEQKSKENKDRIDSLKNDIETKKNLLINTILSNHNKLIRDSEAVGKNIDVELQKHLNRKRLMEEKLKLIVDSKEVINLKKELNDEIENLERMNYSLKFELYDCERCNNNVTVIGNNRVPKRRRSNEEILIDDDFKPTLIENLKKETYDMIDLTVLKNKLEKQDENLNKINMEPVQICLKQAQSLIKDNDFKKALTCLKKAIEIDPDNIDVHLEKSRALAAQGKHSDAINSCDLTIELIVKLIKTYNLKGVCLNELVKKESPECFQTFLIKAESLFNLKEFKQAMDLYDSALQINPNSLEALKKKGIILKKLDRNQEAIECFDKALKINNKDSELIYHKGVALYNLETVKDLKKALECFNEAIRIKPDANSYKKKGDVYCEFNQFREALDCFNLALQLNPAHPYIHNNKGEVCRELNKLTEALDCFDKAIELCPTDPYLYNNKGEVYDELKNYKEAIKYYEKAIELNPNESVYYFNKGCTLYFLKKNANYKQAMECYDKAIELNPNVSKYYENKGYMLFNLKKYKEAIECYDKSIQLKPNSPDTFNNKGMALDKLKLFDESREAYNKAIELDPGNKKYHRNKKLSADESKRHQRSSMNKLQISL